MAQEHAPQPIDLMPHVNRFLKVLRFTLVPILLVSLLVGGMKYYRSIQSYSPYYQATALLTIQTSSDSNSIFSSNSYNSSAVADVVSTLPTLLGTEFMRDLIMAELGTTYIPASISVQSIEDSSLFLLKAQGGNPEVLCDVLNAVITAYPKAAVYMTDNTKLTVIDAPQVPTTPSNSVATVSIGALARSMVKIVLMGLGLTLVLSLLNQSVANEKELKEIISIPLVASLPKVHAKKRRKNREVLLRAADDPSLQEAIRGLRAKVRKSLDDQSGKVVLLTSTIPGEGKTTAAINLALALADEGNRVLLLDADLRNQTIGRLLGNKQRANGLRALLKDSSLSVADCIRTAENSSLDFISGESISTRHYRIDPAALNKILTELTDRYDYVVMDTPPCSVVSDTALLCRHTDCVLYVVRRDYANRARIIDSVLGMHQQGIRLTGCILNGSARTRRHYGYGYGYSKKYGYGRKH